MAVAFAADVGEGGANRRENKVTFAWTGRCPFAPNPAQARWGRVREASCAYVRPWHGGGCVFDALC